MGMVASSVTSAEDRDRGGQRPGVRHQPVEGGVGRGGAVEGGVGRGGARHSGEEGEAGTQSFLGHRYQGQAEQQRLGREVSRAVWRLELQTNHR